MQKIANPQQNQGVQRFFCFVTVKDGSIAFFSEKCSNAFGDLMESGYVLHRKVFASGRIRGYDRLL